MIVEARRKQHYIALDGEYSHYVSYHVHYHILTSQCSYLENTIIHGEIYHVQRNMIRNTITGIWGINTRTLLYQHNEQSTTTATIAYVLIFTLGTKHDIQCSFQQSSGRVQRPIISSNCGKLYNNSKVQLQQQKLWTNTIYQVHKCHKLSPLASTEGDNCLCGGATYILIIQCIAPCIAS